MVNVENRSPSTLTVTVMQNPGVELWKEIIKPCDKKEITCSLCCTYNVDREIYVTVVEKCKTWEFPASKIDGYDKIDLTVQTATTIQVQRYKSRSTIFGLRKPKMELVSTFTWPPEENPNSDENV